MPYPPRTTVRPRLNGSQAKPKRGEKFLYLAEESCGPMMLRMYWQFTTAASVTFAQALFWLVSARMLKSTSQRNPRFRVKLGSAFQSSCTNNPMYVLREVGALGGAGGLASLLGAALLRVTAMGISKSL